uniref:Cyclin B1 n=1 Tax=Hirondellea gigas TaxID=1518452 RepID=A0A6A7G4W4_9CRUS
MAARTKRVHMLTRAMMKPQAKSSTPLGDISNLNLNTNSTNKSDAEKARIGHSKTRAAPREFPVADSQRQTLIISRRQNSRKRRSGELGSFADASTSISEKKFRNQSHPPISNTQMLDDVGADSFVSSSDSSRSQSVVDSDVMSDVGNSPAVFRPRGLEDMVDFSLEPPPGPTPDCDLDSINDHLCSPNYCDGIMDHLRNTELKYLPVSNYLTTVQNDINGRMRTILIDWLIEVHEKFTLKNQTLYLAVNYLDRFLSLRRISRSKLQLVGCTALFLAAKFEEIYHPQIADFVFVSDSACSHNGIIQMEQMMMETLKWNLLVATPFRFCERFLRVAGVGAQRDKGPNQRTRDNIVSKTQFYAQFILELCLTETGMLEFKPSKLAASAVFLALKITRVLVNWSDILKAHTKFSETDLEDCCRQIKHILLHPNPKEKSIRKKYKRPKYGAVARISLRSSAS